MTDHAELRRLAEAATDKPGPWYLLENSYAVWAAVTSGNAHRCIASDIQPYNTRAYIAAVDPQTVLALLDAAERGERAIELLRAVRGWDRQSTGRADENERQHAWPGKEIDAFLAEVDRAE